MLGTGLLLAWGFGHLLAALVIGQVAEAAVVVFLFAVGELLEGVASSRARGGIQALAQLTPPTALVLKKGKVFELPADGLIVEGQSSLDNSPVTSESVPVYKAVGQHVYADSNHLDGVPEGVESAAVQ